MAVVVVGRELLVTALRSFMEQQGSDFSAQMAGKLKMVLQCAAAIISLVLLSYAVRYASRLAGPAGPDRRVAGRRLHRLFWHRLCPHRHPAGTQHLTRRALQTDD